jgi:hypothetical protein
MCRTPLTGVLRIYLASAPVASNTNGGKAPLSPAGSGSGSDSGSQQGEVKSRLSSHSSEGSEYHELCAWREYYECLGLDVTFDTCVCAAYQRFLAWEKVCRCMSLYPYCKCGAREAVAAVDPAAGGAAQPVAVAPPAPVAPAPVAGPPARKRKYAKGEIKPWMRPSLDDESADEGNDRDEWEQEEVRRLCLCQEGHRCTCGCKVTLSRKEWKRVEQLPDYVPGDA